MPIITTLVIFIVSNALYSSLDLIDVGVKYWMLIIRFFTGVASANVAVSRSYIAGATKVDERTHALSMASLAQVGGFIVGPLLQAGFTAIGDGFVLPFGFHVSMYTVPGKNFFKKNFWVTFSINYIFIIRLGKCFARCC